MSITALFFLFILLEQALLAPTSSFPKLFGLLLGVAVFWLVPQTRRWLWWVAAIGLGVAHIGILGLVVFYTQWHTKVQVLHQIGEVLTAARPAFFPKLSPIHANEAAGLLLLAVPSGIVGIFAGFSLLFTRHGWQKKLLGGILVLFASFWGLLVIAVLLLTQSRGAWVGCAGAVLCLALGWGSRLRWATLIVVLLLIVGVYFGRNHPAVATQLQALQGLSETKTVAQALNPASLTYRLRLWSNALLMVQDFGFTGTGLDQFRRLVPTLPLYYSFGNEDVAHAHNMLLHTAVELGIPGLVVYLALLVQLVIAARQALHPARTRLWQRSAAWGLAGGLLAHFVFGLTDAVALGALLGVFWWAQAGLLLALASNVATREQSRHGAALLGLSASAKPAQ